MDNDINRVKDIKQKITYEEIAATQAAEQMMRDLFIKLWIKFLEGIKDRKIEPNMELEFMDERIHLTEHQALGLEMMLTQCYPERH